jgi:hypothetical protein
MHATQRLEGLTTGENTGIPPGLSYGNNPNGGITLFGG